MALQPKEQYLTLCVGDTKIPFFPSKTKDGQSCFRTTLTIFVNEKKEQTQQQPIEEKKNTLIG